MVSVTFSSVIFHYIITFTQPGTSSLLQYSACTTVRVFYSTCVLQCTTISVNFVLPRNLPEWDLRGGGGPYLWTSGGHAALSADGLAGLGDPQ